MITSIAIRNAATFDCTTSVHELKRVNFFFGCNGTGKTTLSKIIADPDKYPDCRILWNNGSELKVYVYNKDFVNHNFSQNVIKGVFTLGEEEVNTREAIENKKIEIDKLSDDITSLIKTLRGDDGKGGKEYELQHLKNEYTELFWSKKQKYDIIFAQALTGFRGSKERFKEKLLCEAQNDLSSVQPLADIKNKASIVFSNALSKLKTFANIQFEKILSFEQEAILSKKVIGKRDIDIAVMIEKLKNSDWVRQGVTYYEGNSRICPFCQQETTERFAKSLTEYFDESFSQDIAALDSLLDSYTEESIQLMQQLQNIIDTNSEFIDIPRLKSDKKSLEFIFSTNIQKINNKKKEPSQIVVLKSVRNILEPINKIINVANNKIKENNDIFDNIKNEKEILTDQIWKFIANELKTDINEYKNKELNISNAINNIKQQLLRKRQEKEGKIQELAKLEKKIVSIQPTLDEINRILASFGFVSFRLDKGIDKNSYKLVRANGTDAHETLSEGERNLVTFLYFYHLLKGSHTESGIGYDKIVVLDDPVSSLDSDSLFIVSTLIRELYNKAGENTYNIKQIFILTHNIYFHKEVTFNKRRKLNTCLSDESFWIIKKIGESSFIEQKKYNPIRTSYEALWNEVRSEHRNNMTIQNTLRRILENYFNLVGGINLNRLYERFKGDDKVKCMALCSWVNDGSHSVFYDAHYCSHDDTAVARFLEIFKDIFKMTGHIEHYNMMMGITSDFISE